MSEETARGLRAGQSLLISGTLATGRDRVHKFLYHEKPNPRDMPHNLEGSVIYHCGPIITGTGDKDFKVVASGPTTSNRMEIYQHWVIGHYGLRAVIGKGGMGEKTLTALKEHGCVYLHTYSGAAAYLADRITAVEGVWMAEELGMAEAMWIFRVSDFPALVTMDSHGNSLHKDIEDSSHEKFLKLINL